MTTDEEDEAIAKLSDYVDGSATDRAEIAAKIASDPDWKRLHDEMLESRDAAKALSGLRKAHAPVTFAEDVTGTIEKRSMGRFFARKTFGDRVPFGALLVIALIALGAIGYVLWSSPTGSLAVDKGGEQHEGSAQIVPTP
jgi:anti-sigma factor RsiW